MGLATALDITESGLSLRDQVSWHLRGNHYPPVPSEMIEPCLLALSLASNGEWEARVPLPEGITHRGNDFATAYQVIEGHHLEAWVITDEDYFV